MSTAEVLTSQCRTCLQTQNKYHHLEDFMESNLQIIEMLDAIAPQIHIRMPIGFASTICLNCSEQLLKSYKFQQMCVNSNDHLIDLLEKSKNMSPPRQDMDEALDPLKSVKCCAIKNDETQRNWKILEQEINLEGNVNTKDYNELKELSPPDITAQCSTFSCSECGRRFRSKKSLKSHEIIHQRNRKANISCDICEMKISGENSYITHMQRHKNIKSEAIDSRNYSCALCFENFKEKYLLINHIDSHRSLSNKIRKNKRIICAKEYLDKAESNIRNAEEFVEESETDTNEIKTIKQEEALVISAIGDQKTHQFPCDTCGKTFDHPYRLKRHSSLHSLERKHICHLCCKNHPTANSLKLHMIKHEPQMKDKTPTDKYNCADCPRRFKTLDLLTAHRQIHAYLSPDSNFFCSYCQCQFVSEMLLIEHITTRHPEIEKHQCNKCEKTFILSHHLSEHLKRHRDNEEHLVCDICDKEFSLMSSLKDHMRCHKNNSSVLCSQCGKTFKKSSSLSQHMKRHIDLKQYTCPECPSRFNCRSDLIKHMSTHRKGKPYQCDMCESRFTRAYSLKKHKALHTGEKPYKCSECDTAFATNDNLRRHMRTHTGEKPYKCKFCDRAYGKSNDLTRHLRKHIGQNTYMCEQCPMSFKYNAELRQHVSEHFTKANIE